MNKIAKPAKFSLNFLLSNELPVYVRNITRPRGQIMLTFFTSNGKTVGINIPRTNLPINLSDRLPDSTIRESNDLRAYLTKGVLELVWPEEAEAILSDPENEDELEQLCKSEFSAKSSFISSRVKDMQEQTEAKTKMSVKEINTDAVTPRVLSIVERLNSNDIQVKNALIELKNTEEEITEFDCKYIIANTNNAKIANFAQNVLVKRTNSKIPYKKEPKEEIEVEASSAINNSSGDFNKDPNRDDFANLTPEELAEEKKREAIARASQMV